MGSRETFKIPPVFNYVEGVPVRTFHIYFKTHDTINPR